MDTVNNVLNEAATGANFYLLLGDFLDEFYHADNATRNCRGFPRRNENE